MDNSGSLDSSCSGNLGSLGYRDSVTVDNSMNMDCLDRKTSTRSMQLFVGSSMKMDYLDCTIELCLPYLLRWQPPRQPM